MSAGNRSIKVGDTVQIGDEKGVVWSCDATSVIIDWPDGDRDDYRTSRFWGFKPLITPAPLRVQGKELGDHMKPGDEWMREDLDAVVAFVSHDGVLLWKDFRNCVLICEGNLNAYWTRTKESE